VPKKRNPGCKCCNNSPIFLQLQACSKSLNGTVIIFKQSGVEVTRATTDANGSATTTHLSIGTYDVTIAAPTARFTDYSGTVTVTSGTFNHTLFFSLPVGAAYVCVTGLDEPAKRVLNASDAGTQFSGTLTWDAAQRLWVGCQTITTNGNCTRPCSADPSITNGCALQLSLGFAVGGAGLWRATYTWPVIGFGGASSWVNCDGSAPAHPLVCPNTARGGAVAATGSGTLTGLGHTAVPVNVTVPISITTGPMTPYGLPPQTGSVAFTE
jgi:hypothetical protein